MSYTEWSVIYGEIPTASKWNQLGSNDAGFRDGSNILDGAILASKLGDHVKVGTFAISATGNQAITGLGFRPRSVLFFPAYATSDGGTSMAGYGFMDEDGVQMAYTTATRITTTNKSARTLLTTRCIIAGTIATNGAYSLATEASYVSIDADGFTINNNVAGALTVMYVALG
jgi:hypothetical protein